MNWNIGIAMEYKLIKHPVHPIHILNINGYIASDELIQMVKELWKNDEYLSATHMMWDFSLSESNYYFEDIFKLFQFVKKNKHSQMLKMLAIVAPKDNEFGISRMYAMLNESDNPKIEVYREIVDAEQWLLESQFSKA